LKERESKKSADNPPLILVNPVEGRSNLAFKRFASEPKDDKTENNARGDGCYEFTRFELQVAEEKTHNV
jgi:hypothetical protein